jgi:hypothetical protein
MGIKSKGKSGSRAESCVVENGAKLWKAVVAAGLRKGGND